MRIYKEIAWTCVPFLEKCFSGAMKIASVADRVPNEIILRASAIDAFQNCKEYFRRRYLQKLVPVKPSMHQVFGTAIHAGVAAFWRGGEPGDVIAMAQAEATTLDQFLLTVPERARWDEMVESVPDMLEVYMLHYDSQRDGDYLIEEPRNNQLAGATVTGTLDRVDPERVHDLKTGSPVKNWKQQWRVSALRKAQLSIYDWLARSKSPPVLEVLTKPFRGRKPEVVEIELPEIAVWRERFAAQLEATVREMVYYIRNNSKSTWWPMNGLACITQYGICEYEPLCTYGETPKNVKLYQAEAPS